jgi:hypothetical protein
MNIRTLILGLFMCFGTLIISYLLMSILHENHHRNISMMIGHCNEYKINDGDLSNLNYFQCTNRSEGVTQSDLETEKILHLQLDHQDYTLQMIISFMIICSFFVLVFKKVPKTL